MPELHVTHAPLQQSPGDQRLPGVYARAVQVENVLRLVGHVEGVGGVALHAKGQLERLNARLQPPVEARFAVLLVQLPQQIELPPLDGRGGVRAANVLDQFVDLLVLRIDVRALIHAGQEP